MTNDYKDRNPNVFGYFFNKKFLLEYQRSSPNGKMSFERKPVDSWIIFPVVTGSQ